jgi:hypothetical protein
MLLGVVMAETWPCPPPAHLPAGDREATSIGYRRTAFLRRCESKTAQMRARFYYLFYGTRMGGEPIHTVKNTRVADFETPPISLTPLIPSTFAQFCSTRSAPEELASIHPTVVGPLTSERGTRSEEGPPSLLKRYSRKRGSGPEPQAAVHSAPRESSSRGLRVRACRRNSASA